MGSFSTSHGDICGGGIGGGDMTEIKIDLRLGYGRLSEREPFILAAGSPCVLKFESDYNLADCIVSISDGVKSVVKREKNVVAVEVPSQFVKAGRLNVEIGLVVSEKTVKTWKVEPIIFKENDEGLNGSPELDLILQRLVNLETVVNIMTAQCAEFAENIAEHSTNISALFAAIEQ